MAQPPLDFDPRGQVELNEAPEFVVVGEHDVDFPLALSKARADSTPGAKYEILDAAHLSP